MQCSTQRKWLFYCPHFFLNRKPEKKPKQTKQKLTLTAALHLWHTSKSQTPIIDVSLFTTFLQASAAHLKLIKLCPQGKKGIRKTSSHPSLQTDPCPQSFVWGTCRKGIMSYWGWNAAQYDPSFFSSSLGKVFFTWHLLSVLGGYA